MIISSEEILNQCGNKLTLLGTVTLIYYTHDVIIGSYRTVMCYAALELKVAIGAGHTLTTLL